MLAISLERSSLRGNSTWHKNTCRSNNEDASQGGASKWFKEENMSIVDFWAPESGGSLGFLNSVSQSCPSRAVQQRGDFLPFVSVFARVREDPIKL